MRTTIKQLSIVTVLLSTFLFFSLPSLNLVTVSAEATTKDKEKAEDKAKKEAEKAAKEKAEQTGDVAEPPSGPDVNINEVEEEVDIETPASVTGQKVDGTGTVTDFSTNGSKAFYTITDSEQKVFYLIIDLDKTDNNVYFLSDIDKANLSGEGKKEDASQVSTPNDQIDSAQVQPEAQQKDAEGGGNGFLIVVLLLGVVGVAAYYFLVMKKKHAQNNEEEDDDEMSEDYEDDFYENEEAQVNKDNQ